MISWEVGQSILDFEAEQAERESYLEKEMHDLKNQALDKLKSIVHFEYLKEFSIILSFGCYQEMPEAEKIAKDMHLTQSELIALNDNLDIFKEHMREQYEYARY